MHICFIVEGYPYSGDPFMTFIRELVIELADNGVKCTVVAPQSISRSIRLGLPIRPKHWVDHSNNGVLINVYQPKYISLSNKGRKLSNKFLYCIVNKCVSEIDEDIDCYYAHFWHMGLIASHIKDNKPIFVACGESEIIVQDFSDELEIKNLISRTKGIIYVSSENIEKSKSKGLHKEPYIVAPNGFSRNAFFPKDKSTCRHQLGWNDDSFIISFLGGFVERKGPDRLCKAIDLLAKKGKTISSCFIGSGYIDPQCSNILFKGKLEHDKVIDYLCSSDVFVLPTLQEGCCNAIIEALACGLPVISSNRHFNDDILDSNCSIRVNTENVEEIANAIEQLYDNPSVLYELRMGAINKAKSLTIDARARRIITFINENL